MYLVLKPQTFLTGQRGVDLLYECIATDDPFRADKCLQEGYKVYLLQLPEVLEIENTITTIEKLNSEVE